MTFKMYRKNCIGLHIALSWLLRMLKIYWKKQYGLHVAVVGFKMGARWVHHRLWMLYDRCKIHRKKWYGFDIALDGFKMGSRWVQHRLWKKVSRWPQGSSGVRIGPSITLQIPKPNYAPHPPPLGGQYYKY